jgi:HK97 family phage major capsid protein
LTPDNDHDHQHLEEYFQEAPLPGEAPGAKLNGYPWARSLGAFLAAIADKDDKSGARGIIRQVMEQDRPRAAAGLSERLPAEGGFLVPEVLARKIETYMTGAVIVPRSQQIPMTSLRQPVPVLDAPNQSSGVLGGMTFSMVAESANIPATVPVFGVLSLEARKFAAYLTSVPNELCDDSPVFSEIFLPQIVGRGLAWQEDYLAINGDGIAEPQGLLNAPAALYQVRATSDTVGVADIVGMLKQLHPQSKRSESTVWLLGDDVFGVLLELATITGTTPTSGVSAPQLWLDYDADAGFWRLLGYPAFPTDWQPALGSTGDCILVDLSLYLWGDRGAMTVERSMKGGGFINDTSNFRFRHRIDGRLWPQQSYTLSNSQVVSPLVILEEAA